MSDRSTDKIELVASGTATTASTTTTGMPTRRWSEGVLLFYVTAVTGTAPLLDITVQIADRDAASYHTHPSFRKPYQITAAGNYALVIDGLADKMRLSLTVSGTSPSFTWGVVLVGKN